MAVDQNVIKSLREIVMNQLAADLVSVQPMGNHLLRDIMEHGMSESELLAAGYEPVDPQTRLMWIKKV